MNDRPSRPSPNRATGLSAAVFPFRRVLAGLDFTARQLMGSVLEARSIASYLQDLPDREVLDCDPFGALAGIDESSARSPAPEHPKPGMGGASWPQVKPNSSSADLPRSLQPTHIEPVQSDREAAIPSFSLSPLSQKRGSGDRTTLRQTPAPPSAATPLRVQPTKAIPTPVPPAMPPQSSIDAETPPLARAGDLSRSSSPMTETGDRHRFGHPPIATDPTPTSPTQTVDHRLPRDTAFGDRPIALSPPFQSKAQNNSAPASNSTPAIALIDALASELLQGQSRGTLPTPNRLHSSASQARPSAARSPSAIPFAPSPPDERVFPTAPAIAPIGRTGEDSAEFAISEPTGRRSPLRQSPAAPLGSTDSPPPIDAMPAEFWADPSAIADWVNEVLVEQARRHGVDLS